MKVLSVLNLIMLISIFCSACSKNEISVFEKNQVRRAAGETLRDKEKIDVIVGEIESNKERIKEKVNSMNSMVKD